MSRVRSPSFHTTYIHACNTRVWCGASRIFIETRIAPLVDTWRSPCLNTKMQFKRWVECKKRSFKLQIIVLVDAQCRNWSELEQQNVSVPKWPSRTLLNYWIPGDHDRIGYVTWWPTYIIIYFSSRRGSVTNALVQKRPRELCWTTQHQENMTVFAILWPDGLLLSLLWNCFDSKVDSKLIYYSNILHIIVIKFHSSSKFILSYRQG